MAETIRDKVARLDGLRRELRALQGRAEGDDYRLYPPAAPGEVRAHERRGRPFPPSFRAFLELANAWRGFMNGWTLLGLRRRETELYFREGLDEKVLGVLRDLVPEAELKSLSTREKTDPKVLSPRDHHVVGVDGRGSVLVLDDMRSSGGEPELALVKYIWVQKRWPSFGAMLDEAVVEAEREVERLRAAATPPPNPKERGAKGAKGNAKPKGKSKGKAAPGAERDPADTAAPKRRVVEIRPPTKTKTKTKAKTKTPPPSPKAAAASPKAAKKKAAKPAKKTGSAKKKR